MAPAYFFTFVAMKEELLTKKLRKIAQDIALLSYDMENNKSRQRFFSDLIKQRVFELYDVLAELNSETPKDQDSKKEMQFIKKDASREMYRTEELAKQNQLANLEVKEEQQAEKETVRETENPTSLSPAEPIEEKEQDSEPPLMEEIKPETIVPMPLDDKEELQNNEEENFIVDQEITQPPIEQEENKVPPQESIPEPVIIVEEKIEEVKIEMPSLFNSNPVPNKTKNTPLWVELILEEFLQKINQIGGVAAKQQNSPVTSLTAVISISQKHEFINGLFAADVEAYKKAISQIESSKDLEEALQYAENNLVDQFAWKHKEKLASEFVSLIRRRKLV